ncbi:hypothetical protein K505DRAFT_293560 [Melanomma pulvis-pyrius CBS 109.77]|uniref:Dpy-30 domain-containing protein n=1 Tax=Melanomma pulvis-pyrius CBS 109.77 TaxID=1314802 RepID=A0A6A6XU08_9PLEO|nr:hypothetical protein K505DRAFT_293560 [Melanomma pulvis-pyrius CBS 109.77]
MTEPSPIPPPQIAEPEAAPAPALSPVPTADPVQNGTSVDIEMKDDAPTEQPTPQAFIPTPSPAPAPVHTSTRNSPHPTAPQSAPLHANPHGSPTRVYLNQNVTPHLLEAMKHLVTTEPDKPLKWLSEFLAQKSLEIEGP